jgi:hypothetical protein
VIVLQKCTNLEEVVPGPCGEMHTTSDDANHSMNIKAEEVSDVEEDPEPTTFPEIKAEPEVSCMSVCVCHCSADITNVQKCQLSFLSPTLSAHEAISCC